MLTISEFIDNELEKVLTEYRVSYSYEPLTDLPGEEWKEIPRSDGYFISNKGRVKVSAREVRVKGGGSRTIPEHIAPGFIDGKTLRVVLIFKDGTKKNVDIGRLVLAAFTGHVPTVKEYVKHKNGDISDNSIENLEIGTIHQLRKDDWVNHYDTLRAGAINSLQQTKRIAKKVRCKETGEVFDSVKSAGRAFGVESSKISKCIQFNHNVNGYHFELVEE